MGKNARISLVSCRGTYFVYKLSLVNILDLLLITQLFISSKVADPDKANITSAIRADKKEGDTYLVHFFDERKLGKKNYNRSW